MTQEKIIAREQRELQRLTALKEKKKGSGYFWVLFVIIILVNMLDEVSSSIGGTVTTNMIEDPLHEGGFGRSANR